MQPFFENVSKKNQNFKKIKIEVLVSRLVFKLEKQTKNIREGEEKLLMKYLTRFLKVCGIFEHFVFELPQIHEGCFEYLYIRIDYPLETMLLLCCCFCVYLGVILYCIYWVLLFGLFIGYCIFFGGGRIY